MHRFFSDDLNTESSEITLNEVESNHACRVLRLINGDKIELFNGRGVVSLGEISLSHHKHCVIKILEFSTFPHPRQKIHLAIAPTKGNDRFEWFLEKAVEIGVDEITPLLSENSERFNLNYTRLEKVILSAMKQSLRTFMPTLHQPVKVKQFIELNKNVVMAHCNINFERSELRSIENNDSLTLLIGPEGDFSKSEIQFAIQNKVKSVSLGNNRLRTETAGLVAVTLLNAARQ